MSKPRGGLGKGLGAIIPTETVEALDASTDTPSAGLRDIPVGDIIPNEYQPREYFNEEDLVSLTDSIRQLGVLQPVLVREAASGGYELIAGERRWRAAQRVGLTVIPAVIRKVEDQAALEQALVENLHRSELNAIEEAAAYQQLVEDFDLTQDQVALRVGKSRSAVANALRLFQLPPSIQRMVIEGSLTAGHARALLAVPQDEMIALAQRAVNEQLSVRAVEALTRGEDPWGRPDEDEELESAGADAPSDAQSAVDEGEIGVTAPAALLELQELLGDHLETRVGVTMSSTRGRIAIDFADVDDLERIFRLIVTAS